MSDVINNIHTGAVKSEDLIKALYAMPSKPLKLQDIYDGSIRADKITSYADPARQAITRRPTWEYYDGPNIQELTRKETMLSSASTNIVRLNSTSNYSLTTTYDESVWKLEVPGVEYEDIEVYTVKDVIHVDVKDRTFPTFQLAEGEELDSVSLDLGVLTIVIDRPFKRVDIEVG